MSPVSTEPSLSTTRCVIESLFLNTTDCPPKDAGFGEKACVPFELMMVMVVAVPPPPDGADPLGVDVPDVTTPEERA